MMPNAGFDGNRQRRDSETTTRFQADSVDRGCYAIGSDSAYTCHTAYSDTRVCRDKPVCLERPCDGNLGAGFARNPIRDVECGCVLTDC